MRVSHQDSEKRDRLAMRVMALLFFSLAMILSMGAGKPVMASEELYRIENIDVVVNADDATTARDQAIIQAQRQALALLVVRLGAEQGREAELSDDGLGALVQAFEVQNENVSPGRYAGSFAVQFRPGAVRNFLNRRGLDYTETPASPLLVLPIWMSGERAVLWEERTPWREVWEEEAREHGLVPLIVPPGDLGDIALISSYEVADGNVSRFGRLLEKYHVSNLVVATLSLSFDDKGYVEKGRIKTQRFDVDGPVGEPLELALVRAAQEEKMEIGQLLREGVQELRSRWGQAWRKTLVESSMDGGPATIFNVSVPVESLAAWTQMKMKLEQISSIIRINVISMARGFVHIELAFRGNLEALQEELGLLELELASTGGEHWTLQKKSYSFF